MQTAITDPRWFTTLVSDCSQIIEDAKIKAGMVLIEAKYELGKRIWLDYERFGNYNGGKTQQDLADELGVSQKSISDCVRFSETIKLEYNDSFERFSNTVTKPSWRSIALEWLPRKKRFSPIETPPMPEGIFNIIYADPPWRYDFSPTYSREIEAHYPTLSLKEICELDIPSADDSVLFLWATSPKLEEALNVLNLWGFTYRTGMVWVKDKIGMGHWVRGQHELLLIGRKGNMPTPEPKNRPSSYFTAPRTTHSTKPELVYKIIESMYPSGTYLEVFARNKREGWTSWGDQF